MTSPETERLTRVEQKVDDIRDDIGEIKEILKGLDRRYASKITERIVYGLVGVILVIMITAIVSATLRPAPTAKAPSNTTTITAAAAPEPSPVVVVERAGTAGPTPTATPSPSPQPATPVSFIESLFQL